MTDYSLGKVLNLYIQRLPEPRATIRQSLIYHLNLHLYSDDDLLRFLNVTRAPGLLSRRGCERPGLRPRVFLMSMHRLSVVTNTGTERMDHKGE